MHLAGASVPYGHISSSSLYYLFVVHLNSVNMTNVNIKH